MSGERAEAGWMQRRCFGVEMPTVQLDCFPSRCCCWGLYDKHVQRLIHRMIKHQIFNIH